MEKPCAFDFVMEATRLRGRVRASSADLDYCRIQATCRTSYDGKTWLIPGIPEAATAEEALDALHKYQDWIEKR